MKKIGSLLLMAALSLSLLAACGQTPAPQESALPTEPAGAPTETPAGTEAPEITEAPEATQAPEESDPHSGEPSENSGGVAGADDMTTVEEVVEEGMVPIYAESLVEGVYPVVMKSSSSMFKADHCELVVQDGALYAVLYMTSDAYPWMYAGTAEEAAQAEEAHWIPRTESGDYGTFVLPLQALDDGESFAAYSRRKELWYDRTLLFRADSLPAEAFAKGFFTTAESLGLADGSYTVEATLAGGSGRASVASPTLMTVSGGQAEVTIVWSSSNYDYMRIDDTRYLPLTLEGGSTFAIPVSCFDRPMTVYADTTAMSQPHEIEYTLTFDSASIQAAEG